MPVIMYKGLLHLHVTIVSIFILLYLTKVYLLLANKPETLHTLRRKTKVADTVLGSLIVITGVYLLVNVPAIETFLLVKIVLVLVSVPVGIVAMKKASKSLALVVLLLYIYVFTVAKTRSLILKKEAIVTVSDTIYTAKDAVQEGMLIYTAACISCHGTHGKAMVNGAKDLSVSVLSKAETIEIIKSGKGLMPGFKDELNKHQLNVLADYAESLRK